MDGYAQTDEKELNVCHWWGSEVKHYLSLVKSFYGCTSIQ